MAKREFNSSKAIREFVNAGNGVSVKEITAHLSELKGEQFDEKKVYAAVQALATKQEIGKGLWNDDGDPLFVNIDQQDLVARAMFDIERRSAKLNKPKEKKIKTVKEVRKLYDNAEVETYLRNNLDTEPNDKPLDVATLRFPLVGQMSGEDILTRVEERLGDVGEWFISKVHGYTVVGFAAAE